MAHITKISAGKSKRPDHDSDDDAPVKTKIKASPAKTSDKDKTKAEAPKAKNAEKPEVKEAEVVKKTTASKKTTSKTPAKSEKKGLIHTLTTPFRAFGRYVSDSWHELRQVRWPNRKATWKLVFAVFAYTAGFMILITLLDILFTFIFNNILG